MAVVARAVAAMAMAVVARAVEAMARVVVARVAEAMAMVVVARAVELPKDAKQLRFPRHALHRLVAKLDTCLQRRTRRTLAAGEMSCHRCAQVSKATINEQLGQSALCCGHRHYRQ